jgi:rhamnose utilization protein RhaD (predicted bifunctional aldolase and dehydrogenase)
MMWIKASGTWLADAAREDIMVPVRLSALQSAIADFDADLDNVGAFLAKNTSSPALRPSVETSLHAVIPQTVVLHVHCVATIAHAVRVDAQVRLAERLDRLAGVHWQFIPYIRPGAPLTRDVASRLEPEANVWVLGHHGLVVAADTVQAAADLRRRVSDALANPPRRANPADTQFLMQLACGMPYRLPHDPAANAVACDEVSLGLAANGTLYPDHAVFLGSAIVILPVDETLAALAERCAARGVPLPPLVVVPGRGVLIREGALRGTDELARCLADVTSRIPADAPITYLTAAEESELINWDAESYRLSRARGEARA